jgi:hypothetical protein
MHILFSRRRIGRGGGIEPITQSNSAAPEHRRAALLRRVCKGRHPVRDVHCGGSVGVRD